MGRARGVGRFAVLGLVSLGLVAASLPAYADHAPPPAGPVTGSGIQHGREVVQDEVFLGQPCFAATRHVFGVRGEGTYAGVSAEGAEVVYRAELDEGQPVREGPLQVQLENNDTYYHGPYGTHPDASCSAGTAGYAVPATFRVFAAEGTEDTDGDGDVDLLTGEAWVYRVDDAGAKVPCMGRGSFAREGHWSRDNWHADWTLDADCTVAGNEAGTPGQGVAPRYTAHTHKGVHEPWGTDKLRLDYTQHLPVPGLAVTAGGPDSAWVGQPVTVAAGVTDTGAPVTGAAVAFTVEGPAPGTPAGGTGATDAEGRTEFTFTAAVEGDYTVTATATSPLHPGEVVTSTHTVAFTEPVFTMTMDGPAGGQNDEDVTVVATVVDESDPVPGNLTEHDPVPGVAVEFAVSGPGQATPASGTAVTDPFGRAEFTFTGDRAGDYTVTASASHLGQEMSASHEVRLSVKTLQYADAVTVPEDEKDLRSAVIDPAGRYAYFSAFTSPGGRVMKVDLETFERVDVLTLPYEERMLTSAVIDPAGDYAYFGTYDRVVKVDLDTFERVGAIKLEEDEDDLATAVIDPAGRYAYFGTDTSPGQVIKIDLETFERVGAITLPADERYLRSAVIDPAGDYAYFGAEKAVVKVDLNTFQRVAAATLEGDERNLRSAVIDPAGDYAYFGTNTSPGQVIKVDLATFQRVGAITLPRNVGFLQSAVIDPNGNFAYFGTWYRGRTNVVYGSWEVRPPSPPDVVKVDLNTFALTAVASLDGVEGDLSSAVIAPDGAHAYFGTTTKADDTGEVPPPTVVKVSLTRPPNPALVAGDDAYDTAFRTALSVAAPGVLDNDEDTENGEELTAHLRQQPSQGRVSLERDGSFTYTPDPAFSGTDTFTYVASDGRDYSAPATVSITVGDPPEGDIGAVSGSAYGYFTDVSLFGGPYEQRGPEPVVELEPDASNSPQQDSVDSASAQYGPAELFRSGRIDVDAEAALGAEGHSTTSSSVQGDPDPEQRPGPFLYNAVDATCTADGDGVTADTVIINGVVETKYNEDTGEPEETEEVPATPDPGHTVHGTLDHVGDRFTIVFNEQVTNDDGSVIVNAAHMYLHGPTAVGDVIISQATCGVMVTAFDTGAIAGTVTEADSGDPIVGARVTADGHDDTTDADGAYLIEGLDERAYTVTADAAGYHPASQEATVTAGQTTPVDFALTPTTAEPGALAGQVSDAESGAPIAGATITAVDADGVEASATTDTSGDYRIDGLDAGEYTVTAQADGYEPASDAAQVQPGQTAPVDFALTPTTAEPGAVAGQVSDAESGAPIAGATVTAVDADGVEATASTDTGGDYRIDGLDAGDYTVTAQADGYEPASDAAQVQPGQTAPVDFALTRQVEEGGEIAGQVVQHGNNRPIAGATVTAVDADGAQASATTAADGTYRLDGLDAGSYTLTASADGYRPGEQTATVYPGRTTTADFVLKKGGGGSRGGPGGGSGGGPPPGKGPNR